MASKKLLSSSGSKIFSVSYIAGGLPSLCLHVRNFARAPQKFEERVFKVISRSSRARNWNYSWPDTRLGPISPMDTRFALPGMIGLAPPAQALPSTGSLLSEQTPSPQDLHKQNVAALDALSLANQQASLQRIEKAKNLFQQVSISLERERQRQTVVMKLDRMLPEGHQEKIINQIQLLLNDNKAYPEFESNSLKAVPIEPATGKATEPTEAAASTPSSSIQATRSTGSISEAKESESMALPSSGQVGGENTSDVQYVTLTTEEGPGLVFVTLSPNELKVTTEASSVECVALACTPSLRRQLAPLFQGDQFSSLARLTSIALTQATTNDMSAWSTAMVEEREQLFEKFVETSQVICEQLKEGGFWADFIDPSCGKPFYGPHTNSTLFETDEMMERLSDTLRVEDLGCCRVLTHSIFGTRAFTGTLFTDAPHDHALLRHLLAFPPASAESAAGPDEVAEGALAAANS